MNTRLFFFVLIATLSLSACRSSKKATTQPSASQSSKANYEMLDKNTFKLTAVSEDESYGYSSKNAIMVGAGEAMEQGPSNERRYLNALLGPNGEKVQYERQGSCCQVKSDNGIMGYALLDIYEVKYDNSGKTFKLYLNMYDPGEIKAPKGFTFKK